MQLLVDLNNGVVGKSNSREYGIAEISHNNNSLLFKNVNKKTQVWMSHGDHLEKPPDGYIIEAKSKDRVIAAIASIASFLKLISIFFRSKGVSFEVK